MKIQGLYQRNGVYWFRKQSGGRRTAVSLHTSDFAQAVAQAVKMRDGIEKEGDSTILASAITTFLRVRNVRRDRTITNYQLELGKLTDGLVDKKLCSVTSAWLQDRIEVLEQKRSYTPNSINTWILVWKVFFNWCVREKLIKSSPAEGLKYRDAGSRIREDKVCTEEERDRLVASAPNDDLRFILYAGFYAGLRKLEIIEARRDWFDLDRRLITVKQATGNRLRAGEIPFLIKDSTERRISIHNKFHAFLESYLIGRQPLDFALRPDVVHGKTQYRVWFDHGFKAHLKNTGLGWVQTHTMRRTFCTLAILKGISIDVVAFWLGDSPEVTRRHYAHLIKYDTGINLL